MTEGKDLQVHSPDFDPIFPAVVAAAHELKSPLALMRQLSLSLEDDAIDANTRKMMIEQMVLTSERALRLTTDLTRSSRLESDFFQLEPINPLKVCEEVAHELSPLFASRGRSIAVRGRSRPLLAIANKDLLKSIMINFADNALHYSADSETVELTAQLRDNGSVVRLGVRDHGPALTRQLWSQIRRKQSTTPQPIANRPQSSGLGLYIAQSFAKTMNGTVGATRHSDGTTFYVDIKASTQLQLL